jgi:hypothetical protein
MSEWVYGWERKLMAVQCLAHVRTSNPVQLKPGPSSIHPSHTNSSLPPYPIHSGVAFPSPPPRQSSTTTGSASLPAALLPLRPSSLSFVAVRKLPARPTFGKLAGDQGKRHHLPVFHTRFLILFTQLLLEILCQHVCL